MDGCQQKGIPRFNTPPFVANDRVVEHNTPERKATHVESKEKRKLSFDFDDDQTSKKVCESFENTFDENMRALLDASKIEEGWVSAYFPPANMNILCDLREVKSVVHARGICRETFYIDGKPTFKVQKLFYSCKLLGSINLCKNCEKNNKLKCDAGSVKYVLSKC